MADGLTPYKSKETIASSTVGPTNPLQQLHEYAEQQPDGYGLKLRMWAGALDGIVHQLGQFPALTETSSTDQTSDGADTRTAGASGTEGADDCKDEQALLDDLLVLQQLRELTGKLMYSGSGSESDFSILPVILEWTDTPTHAYTPTMRDGGGATASDYPLAPLVESLGIERAVHEKFPRPNVFWTKPQFRRHVEEKLVNDVFTMGPEGAVFGEEPQAKFTAATDLLTRTVGFPIVQVFMGADGMFNPIPLFWLGPSLNSGNLIGLMTAVVWT